MLTCKSGLPAGILPILPTLAGYLGRLRTMTTISDMLRRYREEEMPNLAPRTRKDYVRHLATLDKAFGHYGIDELRPKDIGLFLRVPKGKIQRNRQVAVLSAIYSLAVGSWFVAENNPCLRVKRNPSKPRDRYITDAEFAVVYWMAPDSVQLAMSLALLTGQRQGDIISLKWEQCTPEGITFQQSKTGKKLRVKMSKHLKYILARAKRQPPDSPKEYVIRTRSGERYTSEGFRALWQRVMRKVKEAKALESPFTFHDIRAKCVSDSSSLEAAMNRAGHQSMQMTRSVYDRGIRDVEPLS